MTHGEIDINAIQKEAYEQGLKDGLKEPRSPCACRGREPRERGKRWQSTVDPYWYSMVRGGHYKNLVEIMVFALPGEKPCS